MNVKTIPKEIIASQKIFSFSREEVIEALKMYAQSKNYLVPTNGRCYIHGLDENRSPQTVTLDVVEVD